MPVSGAHISATIMCEGEALGEYIHKPDDSPVHLERYIESKSGKEYQIQVGFTNPEGNRQDMRLKVAIDGKEVIKHVYQKGRQQTRPLAGVSLKREPTVIPFQFAKIETCESDDEEMIQEDALKEVGTITLAFFRCTLGPSRKWQPSAGPEHFQGGVSAKMHEMSKKMVTERTSYGPAKKLADPGTLCTVYNAASTPFLTFTFRYLSAALLELRDIKPKPDQPAQPGPSATTPSLSPPPRPSASSSSKAVAGQGRTGTIAHKEEADSKPHIPGKRKRDQRAGQEVIVLNDSSDEDEKPKVSSKGKGKRARGSDYIVID